MEEAIIQKLLEANSVTAIASTRIYPGLRLQSSELPSVIINTISSDPSYSDDGYDGIDESRIQIDCIGDTYSSAKNLARAVVLELGAFSGNVSGVKFYYITLDTQKDTTDAGVGGSEYLFRTTLDFAVTFGN